MQSILYEDLLMNASWPELLPPFPALFPQCSPGTGPGVQLTRKGQTRTAAKGMMTSGVQSRVLVHNNKIENGMLAD